MPLPPASGCQDTERRVINLQEALDAKHAALTDLGRYSLQHGTLESMPLTEISLTDALIAGWAEFTELGREDHAKRIAELEAELGI
jgi:hypothetical protein